MKTYIKSFEVLETMGNEELKDKLKEIESRVELEPYTVPKESVAVIRDVLGLNQLHTHEELVCLRHMVVEHYQNRLDNEDKGYFYGHWHKLSLLMASITTCIDVRLRELGCHIIERR